MDGPASGSAWSGGFDGPAPGSAWCAGFDRTAVGSAWPRVPQRGAAAAAPGEVGEMPGPSGIRAAVFPASRLRFGDDLEPDFTKYYLEHSLPFARFALILAVLLYALFGILDFFIVPDAAR